MIPLLQDMKLFEEDAILLASRKIAGLSGDIRKAFQICRAAAELVLQKWESESEPQDLKKITFPTVRISDVQKASRESFNVGLSIATSFLRPFQALLLISLASLYRTTGRETGFDIVDIMTKMEAIAGSSGDPQYNPPPSFGETIHLLNSLGESNLVGLKTDKSSLVSFRASRGGSGGAWPVVRMLVQEGELLRGFKKTPHKSLFEKNLPSIF
jgi:origin recognition complex subunit 1